MSNDAEYKTLIDLLNMLKDVRRQMKPDTCSPECEQTLKAAIQTTATLALNHKRVNSITDGFVDVWN